MAESSSPALPGDVEWLPGPGGTWVLRIHPASAEAPALILRVLGGGERRLEAGPPPATEYAIPAELDWSAAWLQWADGTRAALPLPHGPHAEVIELRPRRFARNEPPAEAGWRGEIAPRVRDALEAASRLELGEESQSPREASPAVDTARGGLEPQGENPRAAGHAPGDHETPDADEAPGAAAVSPGDDGVPGAAAVSPRDRGAPGAAAVSPGDDGVPGAAAVSPGDDEAPGAVPSDYRTPGAAVSPDDHGVPGAAAVSPGAAVSPDDRGVPGAAAVSPGAAVSLDDRGVPGAAAVSPGAAVSPDDRGAPGAAAVSPDTAVGAAGPSWTTPPQLSGSTREAEVAWRERSDELRRELSDAAGAIARARDGERSARDAVLTALAAARADLRASRAAREADASALTAVTGELGAERAAHAVTRGSVGTLADALSAARAELAAAKTRGEAVQADLAVARAELVAARATGAAELAEARSDASQARAEAASLREALALRDRPLAGRGDLGRLAREQAEAAAIARRSTELSAELLANLDAAAAALRAAVPATADGTSDHEPAGGSPAAASSGEEPAGASPAAASRAASSGEETAGASPTGASLAGSRGEETAGASPTGASLAGSRGEEPAGASPAAASSGEETAGASPTGASPAGSRGEATVVPASSVHGGLAGAHLAGTASSGGTETVTSAGVDAAPPDGGVTASSLAADVVAPASAALVAELRLRRALIALAREDGVAAGALLVGLLPAQGAVLEGTLTYDVTVRGVGTFAVFVADGSARIVRLSRRRPRAQALFHLSAEPYVLAELLAGERDKVGRFRRKARLSGRRKRAKELLPLVESKLSLADAVKAGARLEPGLVYRTLPLAVDPEWTRGHNFTVAQQIVELAPHAWHVTARDGERLHVVQRDADVRADATVTMSQAAFERMLRNEPPASGDRPQIRGDREAVAVLKRWTDRIRGV